MAIRNRHKIGSHLMMDDESAFVHYREDMRRIWDGTFRHKKNFETRQPQEFVRAKADPRALRNIRPDDPLTVFATAAGCIGNTPLVTSNGPASHIFAYKRPLLTEEHKLPDSGLFQGESLLDEDGVCLFDEGV